MMLKNNRIIPTNRHNPCPVCGKTDGDCRILPDETTFCFTFSSARRLEKINGFICVKEADGHTATFKPDNSAEWSEEQRQEWELQKLERQKQAAQQRQKQIERQLPAVERDRHYRRILEQLTLTPEDRDRLLGRGFTLEQIQKEGYKSVTAWQQIQGVPLNLPEWQKINNSFPANLPGLLPNRRLNIHADGILYPVYNQAGLIVALQVRLHESTDGRYRWLTSSTQKHPDGATPHYNGELPLGIFEPESPLANTIWLTEGTGFKPSLTRHRLNVPVIGAASGRFNSSPATAASAVSYLSAKYQTKVLTFAIDAGDVVNQSGVPDRWLQQFEFFTSLGYQCRIAWWGQLSKEFDDIDELSDVSIIQFITVQQFSSLVETYFPPQEKNSTPNSEDTYWEQVATAQRKLHSLTYPADIYCDPNQKYISDFASQIPRQGIVFIKAPKGSGKSVLIKKIKDLCCGGYWETRPRQKSTQLSLISSQPEVEQIWHDKTGMKFLSITARIALGREQAIRWDFSWIEDVDLSDQGQTFHDGDTLVQTRTVLETIDNIGLCWDSLGKLFDRDWSNTLLVLDEIELGLAHIATSSTCKDRRSQILLTLQTKLKECLNHGGLVIGADADLSDVTYEYITSIVPGHQPFVVVHNYNRPDSDQWDIEFHTGNRDEILSQISDWLANPDCEPIAIAMDNQSEAEALSKHLLKKYPYLNSLEQGLIRIDSRTTQLDFGKNFVKRPNESIEKYRPKVLIYTPSLGVGCSIDTEHFVQVYGLFFGNIEPSQCRQALARIRSNVPRIIWAKEKVVNRSDDNFSFLPEEIKKRMFTHHETTTELLNLAVYLVRERINRRDLDQDLLPDLVETLQNMMGTNGSWNNPHIDLFCQVLARRNFSLNQFSVQLRQELIEEGHNLVDISSAAKTSTGESVRFEKDEIKQHRAAMVAQAPDISLEEARNLNRKTTKTEAETYKITKAFIKDELPGLPLTAKFIYEAIYKDNRQWLNQVKLFWMCFNIEATKETDRRHWKYKLGQFAKGVPYIPDLKTYSLQVEAICQSKVLDLISLTDFETEYSEGNEKVQEWFNHLKKQKKILKAAFGINITGKTYPIALINRIIGKIGLKLRKTRKECDVTYYCLDQEPLLDADRVAVLAALDLRAEIFMQEQEQVVRSPLPSLEPNIQQETVNITLSPTQQEAIAQTDKSIRKREPLCNLENLPAIIKWERRLNRAVLLGTEVAMALYSSLPPELINSVWQLLTNGVQGFYVSLFNVGLA